MTRLARFAARRHRLVPAGAPLAVPVLAVVGVGVGAFGSLGEAGQTDPESASSRSATDQRFALVVARA